MPDFLLTPTLPATFPATMEPPGAYLSTPAEGGGGTVRNVVFEAEPVTLDAEPLTITMTGEGDVELADALAALTNFDIGGRVVFNGTNLTISGADDANGGAGGGVYLTGGNATTLGNGGGFVSIKGGASLDDAGGLAQMEGGESGSGTGGTTLVRGGYSATGNGGEADLIGGPAEDAGAVGGAVIIACGDAPTTVGDLVFIRLRATDPAVEGHAWNDTDIVKVSSP